MHRHPADKKPPLRLVRSAPSASTAAQESSDNAAVPTLRLSLTSTLRRAEGEFCPSAWESLVMRLWPHETISFEQRFSPARGSRDSGYRLCVSLHQAPSARASQTRQILFKALQGALPRWVFRVDSSCSEADELALRARLAPAPAQITRPGSGGPHEVARQSLAPCPGSLPRTFLTVPFDEPLTDGELVLESRIWRPALEEAGLRRLEADWSALHYGNATIVHPLADGIERFHDAALKKSLGELMALWRFSPSRAWCFELRIRSEFPLSLYAIDRIRDDVFGRFPVHVLDADEKPTQHWPLMPAQGWGGFLPANSRLVRRGVPVRETEPDRLPTDKGVLVGLTPAGRRVHLPDTATALHTLVCGSSGSGKSNLLAKIIGCTIEAGEGLILVDPHGDLFDQAMAAVPASRRDDLIAWDLGDSEFSLALNPLEGTRDDPVMRHFVASQFVDINEQMFETDKSSGPMTRNNVEKALLLAMHHPDGGTLPDAARVFLNDTFRDSLLVRADPRLQEYFRQFKKSSGDFGYDNWRAYVTARFAPFVDNPVMLAALGRPSTVNLRQTMDDGRILLIRLTQLQERERRLMGSLVLMMIHAAALGRASSPASSRRLMRVVVDEFGSFATPNIGSLFRESRKFGVALTVATQTLASLRQCGEGLLDAVLTNTAAKLIFRANPLEADLLEAYTRPALASADLAKLPDHHAVMSVPGVAPFCIRTVRAGQDEDGARVDALRRHSGQRWATPRAEAYRWIAQRHGVDLASGAPG